MMMLLAAAALIMAGRKHVVGPLATVMIEATAMIEGQH
jgi:hypothetical protein